MKKTFKILLALMLSSSLLMSLCPITHATIDPNLTYELDFSALDETSTDHYRGLTSTVTANASSLKYHYFGSTDTLTTTTLDGVKALDFNDKDGFLVRSNDDVLFGSKDITLEMWIYKKSTNDSSCMLMRLNNATMEFYYLGAPDAENKMQFMPFPATRERYTFSDYHDVEAWNHIVITRTYDTNTSATTKLYSNGELKGTYTATNLSAFAAPTELYVGNYDSSSNIGTALASLKVYNKVLSAEDIDAKFEAEKSAYNVNDEVIGGGDNTGDNEDDNPTIPPTVDPTDPPTDDSEEETNITYDLDFSELDENSTATNGRGIKNASTMSGITVSHYLPDSAVLKTEEYDGVTALDLGVKSGFLIDSSNAFCSDNISIEMWLYKKDLKSSGDLFQLQRNKSLNQLQMYFTGKESMSTLESFKVCPFYDTNATKNDIKYAYTDDHAVNAWEHIVVTSSYETVSDKTNAVTKIYVNGQLKRTLTGENIQPFEATANRLFIGSYGNTIGAQAGLAELRVYNKELTQSEVLTNFDAQKSVYSGRIPQISAVTDADSTVPDYKTQSITLNFNKDISTFNIGNDNVVVTEKESGKKIATTVSSVDTTNKTVTVSIGQMLKPDKEYIVDFISDTQKPSAFDPQISFTASDYVEKATVTPTKETNNLKVVTGFNEASVGKTCCVLAVVYDETGRMVKTDGAMQKFVVASDNKTCTLNINSTSFGAGYKVKVYAWNMSGLVPMQTISEPVLIEY